MNWIGSAGGPLLLCSASAASEWTGCEAEESGEASTDYEVACRVVDYLTVVQRHGHDYLVLGDAPMETTVFQTATGWTVARWGHCTSQEDATRLLSAIPEVLPSLERSVQFLVSEPAAVLFDSAESGGDMSDQMAFTLRPERYEVTTEELTGPGFEFIIHRIRPA